MANSGDSGDKKQWSKIKIGGALGGGAGVVGVVLYLFKNGQTLSELMNFINNWPIVLLVFVASIAHVIVECYRENNKTKRNQNAVDGYKEQIKELNEKVKKLEEELKQKDEELKQKDEQCSKLTIDKGNLENKVRSQKKELKRLERILDSKGGAGGTNVIPFNGRNGRNGSNT